MRGQFIFAANHASHLDVPLLLLALPRRIRRRTRPVAAADYWTAGPVRHWLIRSVFRGVLVERQHASVNPLGPAAEALREGDSLILFPEGTRGQGESMLPLKPGIFFLAKRFPDVAVVPVWIQNSNRVLPKGRVIPKPQRCSIKFGTALHWQPGQPQAEFLDDLRAALEALRAERG